MTTAKDIMNSNPEHCLLDTSIHDIMKQFAQKNTDYILVVDDDERLCGIITESDLVDQQANLHIPTAISVFDMVLPIGEDKFEREVARLQALTAEELMVTNLETLSPETSLESIASKMSEVHVHHLPVVQGNTVEGLITKHDVIRALASHL
jgi:CBS domain-containing protein